MTPCCNFLGLFNSLAAAARLLVDIRRRPQVYIPKAHLRSLFVIQARAWPVLRRLESCYSSPRQSYSSASHPATCRLCRRETGPCSVAAETGVQLALLPSLNVGFSLLDGFLNYFIELWTRITESIKDKSVAASAAKGIGSIVLFSQPSNSRSEARRGAFELW